ncbi:MAG TPA: sensor histidine kinase [Actinomycetales bacterium]|nr:sensor histidine kinase [Actinomycetales bacterium]
MITFRRPSWGDLALALAVTALGQSEVWLRDDVQPRPAAAVCELVLGAVLAFRRVAPTTTVVVVAVASTAEALAGVPLQSPLNPIIASAIAAYSLFVHATAHRAVAGGGLMLAAIATQSASQHQELGSFAWAAVLLAGVAAVGWTVRSRTERVGHLEKEALDLERAREEQAREAVARERARIARELHDVVSHSISVIAIQAQAVARRLGPGHEKEVDDLRAVESTARQAMVEMRRLLGVLRADGEALPLAPQPGLDQLPALVERATKAGLHVEVTTSGTPVQLPAGLDLTAYRVVQEALTNTLKHASARTASVALGFAPGELRLTVEDDGRGHADGVVAAASPGQGHGLIGMAERVSFYGGQLRTGPLDGRGFRVDVRLPIERS